jgi:hypothetical protein
MEERITIKHLLHEGSRTLFSKEKVLIQFDVLATRVLEVEGNSV